MLSQVAGTYILSRCAAGEQPSRKSSNVQPLTGPATLQDGAASAGAPQAKRPVRSSAQPRQTVKSIEVLLDTVVTEMKTE